MRVLAYAGARQRGRHTLWRLTHSGSAILCDKVAEGVQPTEQRWGDTSLQTLGTASHIIYGLYGTDALLCDCPALLMERYLSTFGDAWVLTSEQIDDLVLDELMWDAMPILAGAREEASNG